jgi:hypothetical protein
MGLANLVALPALSYAGIEKWVKLSSMANALVTPLISVVYFYPTYSSTLLFLGFPWAITAPRGIESAVRQVSVDRAVSRCVTSRLRINAVASVGGDDAKKSATA